MADKLHKVFVYGTLKRGEPNHRWFCNQDGTYKFICNARMVEKHPLIIGTRYNIPFLLDSPGNGARVKGEVYEVDNTVLRDLDLLEQHPFYYMREEYDVENLDSDTGERLTVWVYVIKVFKPELLTKPTYEEYSNNGSHGLKYVPRYFRDPGYSPMAEIFN